MKWISVKESLPPIGETVLVHMAKFGKAGKPCHDYFGWLETDGTWTIEGDCKEIKDADNNADYWVVTHWMEIEEPEKEP